MTQMSTDKYSDHDHFQVGLIQHHLMSIRLMARMRMLFIIFQVVSIQIMTLFKTAGWSDGAKVLGKLSVPRRPTYLDDSTTRAYLRLQ